MDLRPNPMPPPLRLLERPRRAMPAPAAAPHTPRAWWQRWWPAWR